MLNYLIKTKIVNKSEIKTLCREILIHVYNALECNVHPPLHSKQRGAPTFIKAFSVYF